MKKPAQPQQPHLRINLLKPQGKPDQIFIRFGKWLLSYGRYIVIIVELIVLICFIYRFVLDYQLENLKKQIDNQVNRIDSQSHDEALIKATQQRLQLIKQTYTTAPNFKSLFDSIAANTPPNIHTNSIELKHTTSANSVEFKVTGYTNNQTDISLFITTLKGKEGDTNNKFSDVQLTSLGYEQGKITFSLTGTAKE